MARMRRLRILAAAFLLAACGTTENEGPPKYRAWCNTESRDVGPWRDTRAEADADRDAHLKKWGWHAVRIDES
jgi:hypothetical protein